MSRILFINSPIRTFAAPNNPPLGLMYMAAQLRYYGHEVDICDLNANRWMIDDREYWLKKHFGKWDYIGLSGLIVTYKQQRWILDFIIKHYEEFGRPVLMTGGGLATSAPEFVKRHMPEIDIIVRGEGEATMMDIANGKPCTFIKGINWKSGAISEACNLWRNNEDQDLIPDLDKLHHPAWDLVPMEEVYLGNPIWGGKAGNSSQIDYEAKRSTNMVVSRGCPNRCGFCYHYVFGKKYRMRSVSDVIMEISELVDIYDIDFVGFVDDNTTAIKDWTRLLCEEMIRCGLPEKVKWGCSATITQLDPELCQLMRKAGCLWVGFGIESADPRMRKIMHKPGTVERATEAVKEVRDAGMWANTTYVLGYPGETLESVRNTADWMVKNDCLNSVFYATPYPGTELWEMALPNIRDQWGGNEDNYIMNLADATDLKVNLTTQTECRLIQWRDDMMNGVRF